MNFDKLIAIFDADWDESKHPRAKNGQFGKGNGGSSAPAKKEKKSTMSKSYKALSAGQKADAKANVASQIKSMSKEKQISVANRVLKAQGKEPIVANKDGTYTWTNKGERVTTQKPPHIKSDKLARAIVSNGYAVPGIKTGISAESAKASASATKASNEGGMTKEQLSAAGRVAAKMNAPKKSSVEGFVGAKPLHNQVVKMGKETEFSLNERYTMSQKLLSKASSKYGEDMASKRQDVPKEELKSVTHWLDNVLRNPNTSTLGDAISQLASRNPESAKVAEGIVSEMFKDPKLADRVSVDPLTKKLTPKDIKNCNLYCEGLAKHLGIKEANSRSSKLSKSEVLNKYYSIGSLIQFKMNSGKYSTYHDLLKDISSDMDKNSKRVATEIVNELGVRNGRYNGK